MEVTEQKRKGFPKLRLSTARLLAAGVVLTALVSMFSFTFGFGYNVRLSENASSTTVFKTLNVKDVHGDSFTAEDLSQSRINLIVVWATTCGPCAEEMPVLEELSKQYDRADVQIVGVCKDVCPDGKKVDEEKLAEELRIIATTGATYPQIVADEKVAGFVNAQVSGTPTMFVVDSKGNIIKSGAGISSVEKGMEYLDGILASVK